MSIKRLNDSALIAVESGGNSQSSGGSSEYDERCFCLKQTNGN